MLPSRAIARSLPSAGLRRQIPSRANPPSALQKLSNGRQFGTSPRNTSSGLSAASTPFRRTHAAAPIVLGGVLSSRSLSLWGYGKKAAPTEDIATSAPPTVVGTASPVEQASEAVPAAPEALPADPTVAATELDLSSIKDLVNAEDILNMPEQIGYLHAIGLNYGWGPTSVMQWTLEHIHVWGGVGWGATIMATAVLLRLLMFYPQVQSVKFGAVMAKMRADPRSKEALKLVQQGLQNKDVEMRQKGQYLNKLLRQEYNTSNWGMLWGLGPIPFTFGLFRILNGMTHVPVPSMETAGYLWFQDLTATDPYFILPAVGTGLMIGALTLNSKYTPAAQKKMLKNMMYIFGVVGFIGTTFLSAAVNLMAVALGASTLVSSLIINNTSFRRAVGLHTTLPDQPIKTTASYEAPRDATLKDRLSGSLDEMKKGFSDQMGNMTGSYQGTDAEKAEKKRRDMIRKLEDMRKKQEREEFEKKYKSR